MKTKTIRFRFEKATKNTYKFDEVPDTGTPPVVGTLYVQKWFIPSAGPGTEASATLQVQEGGAEKFTVADLLK